MIIDKTGEWKDLSFSDLEKYAYKPIFIVGSPRSGTTLLRSIIDAHPDILCPPCETFLFQSLNTIFNGPIWKKHYEPLPFTREAMIKWLRNYILDFFGNLAIRSGKNRWAEKTPIHVQHIAFINEVFPDAQFIHMIRNGCDVVKSLKNVHWGSKSVIKDSKSWVRHVTSGRAAGKDIKSYRYIEIRYEELIKDPEAVCKMLCKFLGEEYDKRMLEYHLPENNSWGRSLKPFKEPKEIGNYPDLNIIEKFLFWRIAGPLMKELGYWK